MRRIVRRLPHSSSARPTATLVGFGGRHSALHPLQRAERRSHAAHLLGGGLFGRGHEHEGAEVSSAVPGAHRVEGLQAGLPILHGGSGTAAVLEVVHRRARAALRIVLLCEAEDSRLRRRKFLRLGCCNASLPLLRTLAGGVACFKTCTQGSLPVSEDPAAHLESAQLLLELLDDAVHVLELGPCLAPLLRRRRLLLRGGRRSSVAAHLEGESSETRRALSRWRWVNARWA
mmetsp:Transcript_54315/g.137717  ORF Transcript_54315/g.137717 Transcript_54315/m.137717 type:complete len:231 (-) Transcript_54315:2-694(-)